MQTAVETDLLSTWIERLGLDVLVRATGLGGLIFLAATAVVLLLEVRATRGRSIWRSRAFVNDVLYTAFYRGGFWAVFVWAALANALEGRLGFLRLNVLSDLPVWASVPIYWIVGDFLLYWLHRLQHSVPWLWVFHSVHHAERELTTLSQNRRHPVEKALNGLVLYLPLAFVLGLSTWTWIPWYIGAQTLEALQHAQLDWRFGPLYRWFVSPVFHSIHHSVDPKHYDRNFGAMFSIWDYAFGTAAPDTGRPAAYGLAGEEAMPESLTAQLLLPFRRLRRPAGGAAIDAAAGRAHVGRTSASASPDPARGR